MDATRFASAVITFTVLACSPAFTRAQEAGSAEAFRALEDYRQMLREEKELMDRTEEAGAALFGRDPRWNPDMGSIAGKVPRDIRIGNWGCTDRIFKAMNRIDDRSVLAMPIYKGSEPVLLRGVDTSKLTVGVEFQFLHPVVVEETFEYPTAGGSTNTVLIFDVAKESTLEELRKRDAAAAEAAKFRTWTDSSGGFAVRAKYVRYVNRNVVLEKEDGTTIELPLGRLSKQDRTFALAEFENAKRAQERSVSPAANPDAKVANPFTGKPTDEAAKASPDIAAMKEEEPAGDEATEVETPAAPMPAPSKRRWLGTTYGSTISHVDGDRWVEVENATGKQKWELKQTGEGPDYVELFNADRNQKWRMHDDRMTFFNNGKWEWIANGHWAEGRVPEVAPAR